MCSLSRKILWPIPFCRFAVMSGRSIPADSRNGVGQISCWFAKGRVTGLALFPHSGNCVWPTYFCWFAEGPPTDLFLLIRKKVTCRPLFADSQKCFWSTSLCRLVEGCLADNFFAHTLTVSAKRPLSADSRKGVRQTSFCLFAEGCWADWHLSASRCAVNSSFCKSSEWFFASCTYKIRYSTLFSWAKSAQLTLRLAVVCAS
jgi:hypothetical protein